MAEMNYLKSEAETTELITEEENSKKKISVEKEKLIHLFQKCVRDIQEKNKFGDTELQDAIKTLKFIWRGRALKYEKWRKTDWKNVVNQCAYITMHGASNATFVIDFIREAVSESLIIKSIAQKSHLKVVSMGGGPGNDVIGLCSVLKEVFGFSGKLEITIGDEVGEWEAIITELSKILKQEDLEGAEGFGSCSEIFQQNLASDPLFFKECFPEALHRQKKDTEFYNHVKEADLIIMMKLLSVMKFGPATETVKVLHGVMKVGAVVLFFDNPFKKTDYIAQWFQNFKVLYELQEKDVEAAGETTNITFRVFRKEEENL